MVLANGAVIEGQVERQGDSIVVEKTTGSRIMFSLDRVEAICESKTDVYWHRCASLSATDAVGHTRLFRWCLQNELVDQAQNQIDLLQEMDLTAAELLELNQSLLEKIRLIQHQRQQQEYARQFAITELPHQLEADGEIRQVSFEQVVTEQRDRAKHVRRLDRATESLPREAVSMFKRRIEPMVIQSCMTASCHDSSAPAMPLRVVSRSSPIPKRMSQENLSQILDQVDLDRPLESPVLRAALSPHGNLDEPILRSESENSILLQQWLVMISSRPSAVQELPDWYRPAMEPPENALVDQKAVQQPVPAPELKNASPIPRAEPASEPGESKPETPASGDPFDPEIFNRRYLKTDNQESNESKDP